MIYSRLIALRTIRCILLAGNVVKLRAAGYEGFGATVGSAKSPVVQVTSLANDSPGSLREADRIR